MRSGAILGESKFVCHSLQKVSGLSLALLSIAMLNPTVGARRGKGKVKWWIEVELKINSKKGT